MRIAFDALGITSHTFCYIIQVGWQKSEKLYWVIGILSIWFSKSEIR